MFESMAALSSRKANGIQEFRGLEGPGCSRLGWHSAQPGNPRVWSLLQQACLCFLLLNAFLLFELAVELPLLNLNIVDFVIFFYLNWRWRACFNQLRWADSYSVFPHLLQAWPVAGIVPRVPKHWQIFPWRPSIRAQSASSSPPFSLVSPSAGIRKCSGGHYCSWAAFGPIHWIVGRGSVCLHWLKQDRRLHR